MTEGEKSVTRQALRALRFETTMSMRGMLSTDRHDPCCTADAGRRRVMAEMHASLQERLDLVDSALRTVGADPDDDHEQEPS